MVSRIIAWPFQSTPVRPEPVPVLLLLSRYKATKQLSKLSGFGGADDTAVATPDPEESGNEEPGGEFDGVDASRVSSRLPWQ